MTKETYDPARYNLLPIGGNTVEIAHPAGWAIISYDVSSQNFSVNEYGVSSGRDVNGPFHEQGIGRNILRYSKEIAEKLGASTINISIVNDGVFTDISEVFEDYAGKLRGSIVTLRRSKKLEIHETSSNLVS
jgi:hypothetical protein